ncbi:FIG00784479: hypothetical protein [hydrothermal vent metagenome]|uniref:1,4-dihydroxy-2-naphthoate polyprenyltransferase n=1 Tax=hydrothermal vent metagenome TaxID=652676 RepID=A0A3B0X271_9ZZZZ
MIKTLLLTSRPPFLLLSLSIVLLGTAIALYQGAQWSIGLFVLITVGAVLSHAAVNMLNEYQDFQSGLDAITDKTPFSGGSGALPSHPAAAPYVLNMVKVILFLLVLLGGYFVALKGWQILPLGLLGVLLIVTYTSNITRLPWICLIAPGLAFGPVMVLGVYFVWTGSFSWLAACLSLIPFFLVNNLLLLNQVPDLKADQVVGRFNILMKHSVKTGFQLFTLFILLAYAMLLFAVIYFRLPDLVWLAFIGLLFAVPMLKMMFASNENVDKLRPALGMNVIINILTPAMIAFGLIWSTL